MIRKLAFTLILTLICATGRLVAQDIIIKNNAEEIKAQILEITDAHIKYQPYENPEGPAFFIAKDDVLLIRYADGHNEIITTPPDEENNLPITPPLRSELVLRKGKFYENEMVIDIHNVGVLMKNNSEALGYLNQGKSYSTAAQVFYTLAGVGFGYSIGYFIGIAANKNARLNRNNVYVGLGIGAGCTGIAIAFNSAAKKNYRKAADSYNKGLQAYQPQPAIPYFALSSAENGIGLAYKF